MVMAETGGARVGRAAVFAAVCVLLTVLGHEVMSGDALPWWAPLGAFGGVFAGAWWFAARERDLASVTAVAVAAQAVLHGGFTFTEMAQPEAMHAGMAHGQGMGLGSTLGMFGIHLLLGLLSGLWLAYGEQSVFRALRSAAQRVRTSFALVQVAPLHLIRVAPAQVVPVRAMRRWRLVHAIVSRGPPGTVAVV